MSTIPALTLAAPAKLNLFLHVLGRRADGYHELQTLFQLIDLSDSLHFTLLDTTDLELRCNNATLSDNDNLVLHAARALREHSGIRQGARITLKKQIPTGAGLGGGSSDAATTLLALNRLWQLDLDPDTLAGIGQTLGADVPLFVRGRSAWAEGIGERLTTVDLPPAWFLVITPPCHISTAGIFSHRELTRNGSAIRMADFLAGRSRNDCEELVRRLYPPVDEALECLGRYAPARMTGTGASVFARFDKEAEARRVQQRIFTADCAEIPALAKAEHFVARGMNSSPARNDRHISQM